MFRDRLVHAFITYRLDSCNSLLVGLCQEQIAKLQRVHNAAAKLVAGAKKFDHVTPILMELHWLPISYRIRFKILVLTFKCLHGAAPLYLSELVVSYVPQRCLRSAEQHLLVESAPKCSRVKLGDRAFARVAPKLWNGLPFDIRACQCFTTFKRLLKTHLFKLAFRP